MALKFTELFCAATSHSGALWRPDLLEGYAGSELHRVFGDHPSGSSNDVYALAERVDRTLLPALRLDCGTEDALLAQNRRFHQHLDTLVIAHQYVEFPGAHDWTYWDVHVRESVGFLAKALGLFSPSDR